MGGPSCENTHTNKGAWTKEEDQHLVVSMVRNADNIGDISPILSVFKGTDILLGIQMVFVQIS